MTTLTTATVDTAVVVFIIAALLGITIYLLRHQSHDVYDDDETDWDAW